MPQRRRTLIIALLFFLICCIGNVFAENLEEPLREVSITDETISTKIALLHFAPVLGDFEQNVARLTDLAEEAFSAGARIVIAPEQATTGYAVSAEQIRGGLGVRAPFERLASLREVARRHSGYLVVGAAEIDDSGTLFNSSILFLPEGTHHVWRKRSIPMWHAQGDLPIDGVKTPFGDLSSMICADIYLQEWTRISALEGADIIAVPANWWGEGGQIESWRARAVENGVWMLIANRWGLERDLRRKSIDLIDTDDAPSAVISPSGEIVLEYRAQPGGSYEDRILYAEIAVPLRHVNSRENTAPLLERRRPSAYQELARRADEKTAIEEPSTAGIFSITALPYRPTTSQANLKRLDEIPVDTEVVLLPGLGISSEPLDCEEQKNGRWSDAYPWNKLRNFVDRHGLDFLLTSVRTACPHRLALAVFRAGEEPLLRPQIHDAWGMPGSGEPPLWIDHPKGRVGLVTGADLLFPEISSLLARARADLVLASSILAAPPAGFHDPALDWTFEEAEAMWRVRANPCFHLALADSSGKGFVVRNDLCFQPEIYPLTPERETKTLYLDSATQRRKYLNSYYEFDLEVLLEESRENE